MLKVDKKVLRKKFLKIRENINNNKESEILLNKKILNFFKNLRNNIVAGYISVNHEIDIFDSMTKIVNNNTLCLPEVVKGNQKLNFNKWYVDSEMVTGLFRIPIPKEKEPIIPNYIIVPLVSFDKKKNRLGYGGGYYDATINYLRKNNKNLKTIGTGFDEQECSSVPFEKFDEPLDMIITPSKIIK